MVNDWKQTTLPIILRQYSPCDIFNCDETGLFWKVTPQRTLAFKNDSCHGGKHSKDRISILVGANMVGEKLPLLVIGKSAHLRVFRNKHVPLEYKSNKKAWMTSVLFEEYVYKLDRQMVSQNRSIALIVDNYPSHPKFPNLRAITLIFLPPNSTSKTQPMDCGIIHSLKSSYRKELMLSMLIAHDAKNDFQPNLLQSLHWLSKAWQLSVSTDTIINCFASAGFTAPTSITNLIQPSPSTGGQLDNIFQRILHLFSAQNPVSIDEFIHVDDNVITCDDDIVMVIKSGKEEDDEQDADEEVDEAVEVAPTPAEAISMLQKVRLTLLKYSNCSTDFQSVDKIHSALTNIAMSSLNQTTLDRYVNIFNA